MSIKPYAIMTRRENEWIAIQTDELLPGDLVSIGEFFPPPETERILTIHCQSERRKTRVSPATYSSCVDPASSTRLCSLENRLPSSRNLSSCDLGPTISISMVSTGTASSLEERRSCKRLASARPTVSLVSPHSPLSELQIDE